MTSYAPSSETNTVTFTASVGDTIKITRPVGYPAYPPGARPNSYSASDTDAWGFKIGDSKLGKFVRTDQVNWDSGYVYYKHEKSGRQIIEFVSNGLQTVSFFIVVAGIQVHDHASIYQGGPAFATYYAETPREET
jgi:hypothetical protein